MALASVWVRQWVHLPLSCGTYRTGDRWTSRSPQPYLKRARIGTNPIVTVVRLNVRKIPNLSHLVRYHLVQYMQMHCTPTFTALSHPLHSRYHSALLHSLHSHTRCTLAIAALSHPLHCHTHCSLATTALSHSLHSRIHCTLAITALSLSLRPLVPYTSRFENVIFIPGCRSGRRFRGPTHWSGR